MERTDLFTVHLNDGINQYELIDLKNISVAEHIKTITFNYMNYDVHKEQMFFNQSQDYINIPSEAKELIISIFDSYGNLIKQKIYKSIKLYKANISFNYDIDYEKDDTYIAVYENAISKEI